MSSLDVMAMNEMKCELAHVISMIKDDAVSFEAQAQANALKALIENQHDEATIEILDQELKMVSPLTNIGYYRDWLFDFGGRGYVLFDLGNGNYEYRCTVEEFMTALKFPDQHSA